MNTKGDFPWKDNDLVRSAYEGNNFLICETGNRSGRAIIFFSSNGIYYPNNEDVFVEYLAKGNDGYEWLHIAKHRKIQKFFQKIIFVRDIYKQWYVTGINARINNADKLLDFLQKEVKGLRVYTCGGSAGGYAAVLFGVLLQADNIFANSAQFLLLPTREYGPFIEEYAPDPSHSKYFDLVSLLPNQSKIFYIFPAQCPCDVFQYTHIRNLQGIYCLQIKSAVHGKTISGICWPFLLTMDTGECVRLYEKYSEKTIEGKVIQKEIVPPVERLLHILYKTGVKMKRMISRIT